MGNCISTVFFENRNISANAPETDQVKRSFATSLDEMCPVRLCLHFLPDVLWYDVAGSWSDLRSVLGSVRFLL